MLAAEKIFTSQKIEVPHPHETRVMDFSHALIMLLKPQPPVTQRLGVVSAHHLHIQNLEPAPLAGLHKLLDRGKIPAREDIAGQPAVHRPCPVMHRNSVDQCDTAGCQTCPDLVEKHRQPARPHMLQHADRHDPVELSALVPVITKREIQTVIKAGICGGLPCISELLFRQGDAGHRDIVAAGCQRTCQPAPAAADIQHTIALCEIQLGGKPCQFGDLRLIKAVFRCMEIAAGILAPGIQKTGKQLVCQVVMMRYIAAGSARQVQVPQPGHAMPDCQRCTTAPVAGPMRRVLHQQRDKRFKTVFWYNKAAIHIGFAKSKVRLHHEPPQGAAVLHSDMGIRSVGTAAKTMGCPTGVGEMQGSGDNDPAHDGQGKKVEHGGNHIWLIC